MGPVLFLIFINDLPDNIRSSVRQFADDCVLYRNIKSPLDCHILQDDLNSLAKWETDWQMKFNVNNCHSNQSNQIKSNIFIGFKIQKQDCYQLHTNIHNTKHTNSKRFKYALQVSLINLIQHFMVSITKLMTGMDL